MNRTDNHFRLRLAALLLTVCFAMLLSLPASAQSAVSSATGTTPEMLEKRIKETETAGDLDETTRITLLELYREASSLISQQRSYEASAHEFARARESAPEQARLQRKELEPVSYTHLTLPTILLV